MCGWVASLGTAPSEARLAEARDAMTTRGPDDAGLRRRDAGPLPFGVAHRRLSILDLSEAGAQPMHDAESGVTLVYNGELYNSPTLRDELRRAGHRFRSTSDTEVLLRGVVEWGDGVLDRIEGIFSFAAVDERRGTALLARDRLGVKPLYWAHHEGTVLAGSTPRSLLTLCPSLADGLDRVALAQYLSLLWVPHPRTLWHSIAKLPPGHALRVEGSDVEQWCY